MTSTYNDERETETMVYATRTEAIQREIVEPIEAGDASADDYNIDAIADAVLAWDRAHGGYCCMASPTVFWRIVEANAR